MTEMTPLFHYAPERQMTASEQCIKEYALEVEHLPIDQLEALKVEELITLSDTEIRVHMLNRLIEEKSE